MSNLRVFDLKNNPLKCDTDFRSLMKWLGTKKVKFFLINMFLLHNVFDHILGQSWKQEQ